jgi:hypothetical protein
VSICHLDEWGRRVFAHTSPVYLACGGDWTMADPEGIRYIRTLVEGAREYVRHTAVRRSDQFTTHHHGEADHLAWLERPFAEALHALPAAASVRGNYQLYPHILLRSGQSTSKHRYGSRSA